CDGTAVQLVSLAVAESLDLNPTENTAHLYDEIGLRVGVLRGEGRDAQEGQFCQNVKLCGSANEGGFGVELGASHSVFRRKGVGQPLSTSRWRRPGAHATGRVGLQRKKPQDR